MRSPVNSVGLLVRRGQDYKVLPKEDTPLDEGDICPDDASEIENHQSNVETREPIIAGSLMTLRFESGVRAK